MRDLVIFGLVLAGSLAALRRPWIGVLVWTWLSIMSPHRYAYGFSYSMPLAAMAAGSTLLGLVITRDRASPFKGTPVTWFALFMLWVTLSWLFGLDAAGDYDQWNKVMKIDLMILVALAVMHDKRHILALAWVATLSLALLGTKGGIFTVLTGGSYRVWGPPGSFIADNNEFALSLVMTIPLLRFLQMQLSQLWARHVLTAMMVLCAFAALGSQSRGALLAISSMALLLWWRGKSRLLGGVVMAVLAVGLVAFMPDSWTNRMNTINTYEQDGSAMGRINAWWTAWFVAWRYPLGVGFNVARPELFARFAPDPNDIHAAHSIYFQVLGNHGFIGLFLFLAIWISVWRTAGKLRKDAAKIPQSRWCSDLASMCQVSLLGYLVGGTFLSLAYFDLPYNLMVLTVLSRSYVTRCAWEREPAVWPGWKIIPGLSPSVKVPKKKAV